MADTIVVNSVTRCAGLTHIRFDGTVNGVAGNFGTTFEEMQNAVERMSTREKFILRLYFDAIDNGIGTFAALKTRAEGRTYMV
jgi:hypothetical protein